MRSGALKALIVALPLLALAMCVQLFKALDLCGNTLRRELPSPDNELKLQYWTRDCGATTGYTTILYLTQSEDNSDLVTGSNGFVLAYEGTADIAVESWNEDALTINVGNREVFNEVNSVRIGFFRPKTIKINYQ